MHSSIRGAIPPCPVTTDNLLSAGTAKAQTSKGLSNMVRDCINALCAMKTIDVGCSGDWTMEGQGQTKTKSVSEWGPTAPFVAMNRDAARFSGSLREH